MKEKFVLPGETTLSTSGKFNKFANDAIKYCFYSLFFFVPFVMYPSTYELFEFNKMWFVFMVTLLIAFFWISKIIISGKINIRRTPFDIPIFLFFLSQLISTVLSLDSHVSFWGYYSRFNGGFLSTLTYIFLYYAFASNLLKIGSDNEENKSVSYKMLMVSLISGVIVALWGLPSHFGYDPTCYVFRGSLDVSCWTDQFHPTARIFSTLGQPNWLAAYLSIVLPISLAFLMGTFLKKRKEENAVPDHISFILQKANPKKKEKTFLNKNFLLKLVFLSVTEIFYLDLIYTNSQSGFLSFWAAILIFFALFLFSKLIKNSFNFLAVYKDDSFKILNITLAILLITAFFIGTPIDRINKFTFPAFQNSLNQNKVQQPKIENTQELINNVKNPNYVGITESSKIRLIVWRGALDIFKKYPVFGSGVETFAYSYYQVRPIEHNMTSEWDYLYNKAHNEYLNFLATTGSFGLLSYLLFIGFFLYKSIKIVIFERIRIYESILGISLIAGFISMLISNFFGFSVVIVNLYIFLIPVMFYEILGKTKDFKEILSVKPEENKEKISLKNKFNKSIKTPEENLSFQIISIVVLGIAAVYFEFLLINFWVADQSYALGYNYNRVGEYTQAYEPLSNAAKLRPGEDLFKDELSVNLATLAVLYYQQDLATQGAVFATQAKELSDQVIKNHPNNVVYFKSRTRVLYALSQIDKNFLKNAELAIEKAHLLAPTDVKIMYNMALLYGQENNTDKAMQILDQAIIMKPDYRDAYYARAVFYNQKAKEIEKTDSVKAKEFNNKAISDLEYILNNIEKNDKTVKELLNSIK